VALASGSKLGPYEILSALGAGGMGEVYRARDTRLGRDVAIKVLPQHLSCNPDLKQRFEREARAASALNHPHICHLYDIGSQDGTDYIVMELLEGESLAERLQKGPLPMAQTLAYGMEMAEALETAHKNGIIHRDLKPGNIMLTKSGLKLLDFGLAKPMTSASNQAAAFSAMTASHGSQPLTAEGTLVGTFQYLSPEQLEGQEADARADIFALGCVLYEMAAGRRAFGGKTQASVVASILASEPPAISSVEPLTPPAFERVVKMCLAKDPEERWQTAHDVKLQLKWIAESPSQAGAPAPVVARRRLHQRVAWALAGLAILAAAGFATAYFVRAGNLRPSLEASLLPPKDFSFSPTESELSPDGSKLAFVALAKDGSRSLWVRPLNALTAQQLAGTEGASYPFWSPDSKTIGFFAEHKLRKIDAGGGPVVSLADAPSGRGGSWNRSGTIIFSPEAEGKGLYEVPAAGGAPAEVQHADKARGEDGFRWSFFMPDGKHYVFFVMSVQTSNGASTRDPVSGVYFAELGKSTKTRILDETDTNAQYTDGYLFYVSQHNLMARAFDPSAGKFTGAAFPVAQQVVFEPLRFIGAFSVSKAGPIEYLGGDEARSQLIWYERGGKEAGRVAVEGAAPEGVTLSPNGSKVATAVGVGSNPVRDIWVYDVARGGVGTRVTSDGLDNEGAIFGRDGQHVFYRKVEGSGVNIYSRASSGLGREEKIIESSASVYPNDLSPDGKTLVYMSFTGPATAPQLWVHEPGSKDHSLLNNQFVSVNAQFSPDGRWLAYQGTESGRSEIYAIAYPSLAMKVQISSGGGGQPRWRKDGREIFYLAPGGKMMAVSIAEKGNDLATGTPVALFDSKVIQVLLSGDQYDVTADGKKFLINTRPEAPPQPATIYANWQADFQK
jgi:serine/threonine protein kinase